MNWAAPHILPLLVILIPVGLLIIIMIRRRRKALLSLFHPNHIEAMLEGRTVPRAYWQLIVRLLAVAFFLTALARPQWGFTWKEVKHRGLDIMVALDTSRSMLAQDIKPDRLQQAKWGIRDLVQSLKGDRVGLTAFAGSAFLQCPLTSDYAAFLMTLEDIYVGIIPKGGTALRAAIRTSMDAFEDTRGVESDKVIILITDGEDHEGHWEPIIREATEREIRIFTVGVGTLEGDIIPSGTAPGGGSGFFKNREGEVVKSSLNEGTLRRIALETGGLYVRSAAGDFGLDTIINEGLMHLQRAEYDSRLAKEYREQFVWFILAGLLLLLAEPFMNRNIKKKVNDL